MELQIHLYVFFTFVIKYVSNKQVALPHPVQIHIYMYTSIGSG